jgi:hypothetical protein
MSEDKIITLHDVDADDMEAFENMMGELGIKFSVNAEVEKSEKVKDVQQAFKALAAGLGSVDEPLVPVINDYTIGHVLMGLAIPTVRIEEQTRYNGLSVEFNFEDKEYVSSSETLENMLYKLQDKLGDYIHGELSLFIGPLLVLATVGINPEEEVLEALYSEKLTLSFLDYDYSNTVEIFKNKETYQNFIKEISETNEDFLEKYKFMFTYAIDEDHTSS